MGKVYDAMKKVTACENTVATNVVKVATTTYSDEPTKTKDFQSLKKALDEWMKAYTAFTTAWEKASGNSKWFLKKKAKSDKVGNFQEGAMYFYENQYKEAKYVVDQYFGAKRIAVLKRLGGAVPAK